MKITSISAGLSRSFFVSETGQGWSCGYQSYHHELVRGVENAVPVPIGGLDGIRSIVSGWNHAFALRADGGVFAWGCNEYGQLGDDTFKARTVPAPVEGLRGVEILAAGYGFSLAVLGGDPWMWCGSDRGGVLSWGHNNCGQLGDDTRTKRKKPALVEGLPRIVAVAAGCYHAVALDEHGCVWTWGNNKQGQLGDGTTTDRSTIVRVAGLPRVVSVFARDYHTHVVDVDGGVWRWGECSLMFSCSSPAPVQGLPPVKTLALGGGHVLALTPDGDVWAWGDNEHGQLGDGEDSLFRETPYPVELPRVISAVAAGRTHSLALAEDGSVYGWGDNEHGQLGLVDLEDNSVRHSTRIPVGEFIC